MTSIEDINLSTDIIEWWFRHKAILPNWHSAFEKWHSAFEKALLIQPSSATVERAFSFLQNSFSNNQADRTHGENVMEAERHRCRQRQKRKFDILLSKETPPCYEHRWIVNLSSTLSMRTRNLYCQKG